MTKVMIKENMWPAMRSYMKKHTFVRVTIPSTSALNYVSGSVTQLNNTRHRLTLTNS